MLNSTLVAYLIGQSESLDQIKLFIWSYILPPICFLGLSTNLLNVVVFFSLRRAKNKLYRYFLVHSACDLAYLLFSFIFFMFKTSLSDNYSSFYWVVVYEYVFFLCVTTMMATLMVFIELMISLKRIFLVLNFNLTFKLKFRTLLALSVLMAIFVHLPMPIALYVKEIRSLIPQGNDSVLGPPKYELAYDRIAGSAFNSIGLSIPVTFRGLIAPTLLILMNIILSKKLGKQLNRKREMVGMRSNTLRLKGE